MKKQLILSAFLAVCMGANAVPAKKGVKKPIRLVDGTTVLAELRGDEFGSCWLAEDGRVFFLDPELRAFREINPVVFARKAIARRSLADKARVARRVSGPRAALGGDHLDYKGKKKGIIILAQYQDKKFRANHDLNYYQNLANQKGFTTVYGHVGSVSDYFLSQSNGQFELDFDVVGPVTLPKNYAYYGAHTKEGANDAHAGTMVAQACKLANEQFDVNFADYDWDGDGEVEQVYVLYAGQGEAAGGDENTVWPHEYSLQYSDYGTPIKLDGVTVDTYACGSEQSVSVVYNYITGTYKLNEYPDGIGTICHEFSHCLGFPDMYDTSYSNWYGMGSWDVMCSGSYNGDGRGYRPANYTAWERMYAGWLQPTVLDKPTTVKGMRPSSQYGQTFIVYNDNHKDEYYLLENRQQEGKWESALPGSGLMVTHVDYSPILWAHNDVNTPADYSSKYGDKYKDWDNDHQRCTIFHADNRSGTNDENADLYPSAGNNQLTDTSTPSAMLYNALANGVKLMGKPITNITQNADGSIDFDFMGGSADNVIDFTTGILELRNDTNKYYDKSVFTLDGQKINDDINQINLHGTFIVRHGNKAYKVLK